MTFVLKLNLWIIRKTRAFQRSHFGNLLPDRFVQFVSQMKLRIVRDYVAISGAEKDMNGKICVYVFAGRQDRMQILVSYLDELLARDLIDEVHVWNFCRNKSDKPWVDSLAEKENYRVLRFIDENIIKQFYRSPKRCMSHVYFCWTAHHYYRQNKYDSCGLIKIDDDIVFIDVPRFTVFKKELMALVNGEQQCYLLTANVVNNGLCDSLRQIAGQMPKAIGDFPYSPPPSVIIENKKICWWYSEYWDNGKKSEKLHDEFLSNPERFTQVNDGLHLTEIGVRLGINFIGMTNKYMDVNFSDELYFSANLGKKLNKPMGIVTGFTAAHLSYTIQYDQNDAILVEKYAALKEKIFQKWRS